MRRVYSLRRDDYLLDIGCGNGKTTRDAAQIAVDGSVVGIDVSEQMIDRARELTEAEGLSNVTFVHGDAQVHPFALERFDVGHQPVRHDVLQRLRRRLRQHRSVNTLGRTARDDDLAGSRTERVVGGDRTLLRSLDAAAAQSRLQRLGETLAAHAGADGVWFDSRAWIVTARRR